MTANIGTDGQQPRVRIPFFWWSNVAQQEDSSASAEDCAHTAHEAEHDPRHSPLD